MKQTTTDPSTLKVMINKQKQCDQQKHERVDAVSQQRGQQRPLEAHTAQRCSRLSPPVAR